MQKAGWWFCCCLFVGQLQGATFYVTNTLDYDIAVPLGSLRQAMLDANDTSGDDTIQILAVGTILLAAELPTITDNTTIIGPSTNLLTISGGNQFRVFSMQAWTTNILSGLTIADGRYPSLDPRPHYASGISNAGSLKLLNCAVRHCMSFYGYGQGIYNGGDMEMEASVVADCGSLGSSSLGGGIYNGGTLRMTNCWISRCRNSPPEGEGGGGILNAGYLTMSASVVESCSSWVDGFGGGIYNSGTAVISDCTVSNCSGWSGGGISGGGFLAITNSTIVDNYSSNLGGGLAAWGTNWLVGCTISGNSDDNFGGGIFTYDGGELRMLNCTVSGNRANSAGGGIGQGETYWSPGTNSRIYANHCTIVSNTSWGSYGGAAGGGVWNGVGVFECRNSIIAGNGTNDFSGVLISQGYNLIQNTSGTTITGVTTGNIYGQDPVLGPLADYGGPTPTMPLLAGSPAIDAGGTVDCLPTDQRGRLRPYGGGCDMGAFESSPPFVIRGTLSGYTLTEPLTVLTSPGEPLTANRGPYSIEGLSPNTYTITPSNANYHLVPSNRVVTVGPDQLNVDFKAYRWNALSLESISDGVLHLIYAGTNGDSVFTLGSSNLVDWTPIATNTVPSTNLFDIFAETSNPQGFYRTVKPW